MSKKSGNLSIGFLYDDTLDKFDGVSQYVKTLGSWLSAQGHEVSYLVGETKSDEWRNGKIYSLSRNLKIKWGGNRLSIPVWAHIQKIKQLIKQRKFDVIHVQVPYSPFMAQRVINRASPSTAVVGTVHVFTTSRVSLAGSRLLRLVYGRSMRRFDQLLSVSPAAQEYAKKAFGKKTLISPNLIDLSSFKKSKAGKKNKREMIVFVGRLVERKGCEYLIRAFKPVQVVFPQARLVIAGGGPERVKLEKLANNLGISAKVDFFGMVDEKRKIDLLSQADIACFPSLYGESFGIVLLEAMAAGAKVVLGGDNDGYRSVLGEHEELLVDPYDTDKFANRIMTLLSDENLAAELNKWQINEVRKYDVEQVGPAIEAIYRRAIANRAKSRHN